MHPKNLEEAGEIAAEIVLSGLKGFLKSPAGMLQAAVHPYDTIKNLPNVLIDGIKSFYSTVTHPEEHKLSDVAEAIGAALFPTPVEGLGGLLAVGVGKAAGEAIAKAASAGKVLQKTGRAAIKELHPKALTHVKRTEEALQNLHNTAKIHSDKVLQDITQTLSHALNMKPNYAFPMALPTGSLGSSEANNLFNEIPTDPTKEENNLYSTISNTPNHEKSPQTTQGKPHKHEAENKKPSSNSTENKEPRLPKKRAEYEKLISDKLPKHIKPIYDHIDDGLEDKQIRVTGIIDGKEITDYNQKRRAALAEKEEYPPYNPEQETLIGGEIKKRNKASLL